MDQCGGLDLHGSVLGVERRGSGAASQVPLMASDGRFESKVRKQQEINELLISKQIIRFQSCEIYWAVKNR